MADPFQTLGLGNRASVDEVKTAYRALGTFCASPSDRQPLPGGA